jgi:hypothetical protein
MADRGSKTPYTPPSVRIVSEEDILKTFQVTSAAGTWWVTVGASG